MAKVREIIDIMERWAPPSLAETWDNIGLITGNPDHEIDSIVVALDVEEPMITRAAAGKTMIITHHPPVFRPLANLSGNDRTSRLVRLAVTLDVPIFACHTNLDQTPGGVSDALASRLCIVGENRLNYVTDKMAKFVTFVPPDFTDTVRHAASDAGAGVIGDYSMCSFTCRGNGTYKPTAEASPYKGSTGELSHTPEDRLEMIVPASLVPSVIHAVRQAHPYDEMAYDIIPLSNGNCSFGYGTVGELPEPMTPDIFATFVAERLDLSTITVSRTEKKSISRVAVMGGSGHGHISAALAAGVDAYVTGEIGHHDFLDYSDRLMLVDATHRATELPVLGRIAEHLKESTLEPSFKIHVDEGETVSTFCNVDCHQ